MGVTRREMEAQLEPGCSQQPLQRRQSRLAPSRLVRRDGLLGDAGTFGQLGLGEVGTVTGQSEETGRNGCRASRMSTWPARSIFGPPAG